MPDENRVFDVSKPSRVSPSATSRPVIVGHHPMNDPMVRDEHDFGAEAPSAATKIQVTDEATGATQGHGVTIAQAMAAHQAAEAPGPHSEDSMPQGSPAIFSEHDEPQPAAVIEPDHPQESIGQGPFTEMEPGSSPQPPSELPPPAAPQEPHIEGLHFNEPGPKRGRGKWILGSFVLLLIAVYLAIDSGLVGGGINLPFHIFKQKTETVSTSKPITNKPAAAGPTLPAGFKEYKLADTNIAFAAPTAWGDPTSTTDPGYALRGGTNQPTGTYAYLVNFATNKDVQVAVTSNKYLPTARTPLYYDYLQWCVGSNDNKFYQSVLNFSTANKIDTPTTITCNQGPITATSIDPSIIVQLKTTDSTGKTIGDVYTANLKDPTLVVFRVKDAAMTNSTDIKLLLGTIHATSTSSAASSGQ
jgi:hypothetical protein